NVAPVLVKPRPAATEVTRLNPEWLNAVVMVRRRVSETVGRGAASGAVPLVTSGILAGTPRTVLTWLPERVTGEVEVVLRDGSVRLGKVSGRDGLTGIAVVGLEESAPMALDWRDGADLAIGDAVHVLGFEGGTGALRAHVALEGGNGLKPMMLDRNVPEGWVGGGVVDGDGRVAGILLPKEKARTTVGAPALGGQELMWTVDSLIQGLPVRRIELGLGLGPRVAVREGGRGWQIRAVEEGSLSAQAGVKPGDVLIAVNEREVAHPGQLPYVAGVSASGEPVVLELDSGGVRRTVLLPVGD
ncbi:MAG: PDZ domain-containing protein, partial [Verrucomicrobiia bacterium]